MTLEPPGGAAVDEAGPFARDGRSMPGHGRPDRNVGIGRAIGWSSVAQIGRQGLQLLVTIILARLLTPEDFGVVGVALVVVGVVTLFKDLGTGAAVIQRPELDQRLLSTVFWSNLAFGAIAAVTLSLLAPAIADAFRQPALSDIIRVLSVSLAVASIAVVPQALLERRLAFSSVARLEVGAVALGGVIGIAAALSGFGAWSLVIQTTMVVLASTLLAWRLGGFRPGFVWAIADLRSVAGFSTALTGFNLFNYAARNADNLLIGRALGADALGKYALAYRLMLAPVQAVTWTINRVMFPVYADLQADDGAFQAAYLRTVGLVSFFALPIVVGLGVVAERLVAVLFGPAWAETATVLAILVPVAGIQTILATVGPIYQAKGRGRALLGWGVLSGTVTVAAFGLGLAGGIQGVATAYLVATLALVGPALVIPFRLIHLDARLFLGRLVGPALAAGTMGLLVWVAGRSLPFGLADPVGLAVLVALGVATYLATSMVTNRAALEAIVGPVLRQRAT